MAWVGGEKMRELEGVLHEAADRPSPAHMAALATHPDALRSALAVAADMLTLASRPRRVRAGMPAVARAAWRASTRLYSGVNDARGAGPMSSARLPATVSAAVFTDCRARWA